MNKNKSRTRFRFCVTESEFVFTLLFGGCLFVWPHKTCCSSSYFWCELFSFACRTAKKIPIFCFFLTSSTWIKMLSGVWCVICGLLCLDLVICEQVVSFFFSFRMNFCCDVCDIYTKVSFFISLHLLGEWAAGVKINVIFMVFFSVIPPRFCCHSQRFMAVS